MVLRYYVKRFKSIVFQFFFQFKLRRRCHIGRKCTISKDLVLGNNCKINNFTTIGPKVKMAENVTIGGFAKINNINIGKNSTLEGGVICTGHGKGKVVVGEESYIGINNVLDWSDNVIIGSFVHIAGPSTGLWTHTSAKMCLYSINRVNKDEKHRPTAPITIENNVYIGGNCTIYPGVTIGHHSIIAPNSAVTKNVESYTMVGGVPARFIKKLTK